MNLLLRFTLAFSTVGTVLPAQERVIVPGGASAAAPRARQCEKPRIEMVDVRPLAAPGAGAVPGEYLERAAREAFFYFNPPEVKRPRYAIVQLVAHSNSSISALKVVESSRNDYFDREVTRALGEAARGGAFAPLPAELGADSLPLELSFGRHAGDTEPFLEKRELCPAWPSSRNPTPEYPRELREHGVPGMVRAQFMVGVDGKIKPGTFSVIQSTDDRFVQAVEAVLPRLRYLPAEVQGRKVEQLTEQTFTFGLQYEPRP